MGVKHYQMRIYYLFMLIVAFYIQFSLPLDIVNWLYKIQGHGESDPRSLKKQQTTLQTTGNDLEIVGSLETTN